MKCPKPVWKRGQLAKTKCIGRWIYFGRFKKKKLQLITFNPPELVIFWQQAFLEKILALATCSRKAYDCLQDEGYHHLLVNHRLHFVDLDKRAHSRALKRHGGERNEVCIVQEHPWIPIKVIHLKTSLSILRRSPTKRDKTQKPTKCTVRDPEMAVPYTGKEENMHFAVLVLRRIRKQKGRTISRKKKKKKAGSH